MSNIKVNFEDNLQINFSQSPIIKNQFQMSQNLTKNKILSDITNLSNSIIKNAKNSNSNISFSQLQTYDKSFPNKLPYNNFSISNNSDIKLSSFLLEQPKKHINENLNSKNINNEKEKLIFINNNIKQEYFNKFSTDIHKFISLNNCYNNLNEQFQLLKKRKSFFNSEKKRFTSFIYFYDEKTNEKICFPLFKDNDIGIDFLWDDNLKYKLCDNDINTKKEIIDKEKENNLYYLNQGIEKYKQIKS